MNLKKVFFNTISIVSSLGIFLWILTDYFGGLIIYFISYKEIITSFVILYFLSLIETVISTIRTGLKNNILKLTSHIITLIIITIFIAINAEFLKSKRVLSAKLNDDLFSYNLILRENGRCENETAGVFGYYKTYKGEYDIKGDTIFFKDKMYDNDFIPDTLLIDKKQNAIFITKDKSGNFIIEKEWLNHFKIEAFDSK